MMTKGTLPARRYWSVLAAILLVAFGVRLAAVAWVPTIPTSDFWSYFQRGSSLADTGVYEAVPGRPDASYPPAYPLLLSLFFRLPVNRLIAAKLVNVVLGTLAVLLLAAVTRSLFGEPPSLIAAAIAALNPRSILCSLLIASENLFLPLLLAWILVMLWSSPRDDWKGPVLGGILLGAATLTRVVAWLLPVPWLLSRSPLNPKARSLVHLLLLVICEVIVMLPWAVRNAIVLGHPTFLTSTAGINLFIGNNPNATGQWYPWLQDMEEIDPAFSRRSLPDQDRAAARAAVRWIGSNPLQAVSLYLTKWRLMFIDDRFPLDAAALATDVTPPWPSADVLAGEHPLKTHSAVLLGFTNAFYWALLSLGILGALRSLPLSRSNAQHPLLSQWLLLVLSALYFPTVSAIFLASSRFHWPTLDLLIPFAANVIGHPLRLALLRRRER